MKQKIGMSVTSLLLCLALVAGLLQGLPVAAKAEDNSIGLGATWYVGDIINLGDGNYFYYNLEYEHWKSAESADGNMAVPEPVLVNGASGCYWKFETCIHRKNSSDVFLEVPVPNDKDDQQKPIGIKITGGKGTSDDPFYFGPVYYHLTENAVGKTWYVGNDVDFGSEDFYLYGEPFRRYKYDDNITCFGYGKETVENPELTASDNRWTFLGCISSCEHGADSSTYLDFDAVDGKKPIGFTLEADGRGYYFEPVYEHSHDNTVFKPWGLNDSLPNEPDNYYLTADVHLSSPWYVPPGSGMTNLCLNNHSIFLEIEGHVIIIGKGTLNLFDHGKGAITHINNKGTGVYIDGGGLGMYGGTIRGNTVSDSNGGGVYVKNDGSFYMGKGSTVENNIAENGNGGGVYVDSTSKFSMEDGAVIRNNRAGKSGGGVYVSESAWFAMVGSTGGNITGNRTYGGGGGGVYAGGTFMYRAGIVDGNKATDGTSDEANNVYLADKKKIEVQDGGTVHSVGVRMEKPGVFVPENGSESKKAWFTSDDARYQVVLEDNEKLALRCIEHDFIYSDEGATITATCKACKLTETLTISKPDHAIYGDQKDPNAKITDDGNIQGDAKINYYKAKGEGTQTEKDGEEFGKAPTDAGTYWAEITLGTGDNSATAHVVYTVAKAENPVEYDEKQEVLKVYSRSDQTETLKSATKGEGQVTYAIVSQSTGSADVAYFTLDGTTLTIKADTPVGVYRVVVRATAAGNENYHPASKESTVTVTIGKALNPLTYEAQTVSVDYSDAAQTATLEEAKNGEGKVTYAIYSQKRGSDDVDFFELDDGTTLTLTIKAGTPAGVYKVVVRATAEGDDNYFEGSADSTVTVTIGRADNPLDYRGQTVERTYSLSAQTAGLRPATKAVGAVRYEIVSQKEKSIILDIIKKALESAIKQYLGDSEQLDPEALENVAKEIAEAILGGGGIDQIKEIISQNIGGPIAEDTLKAIADFILEKLKDATNVDYFALNGTTLTIAPCTPVGTYQVEVRATAKGDGNHKSGSKTASVIVNINKAASVPATVVAIHSTYDGSAKPLVSVTGVATGGKMQYAIESESFAFSESIPTGFDAGTYNVLYRVAGDENHNDFAPVSVQATIAKADASAVAPTALKLVYNGNAQALVEAGQTDDGTMEYALGTSDGATGKYSTDIPTGTDAGDYVVWYRVKGDGNHRNSAAEAVGVTIAKAPITIVTPPNAAAINYSQALKESQLTGGEWTPKVEGHFEWNVEDIVPVVADSGKTAYAVIFFPDDADNYRIARSQTTLEVVPLNPVVIPPEAISGLIYNGKAQALVKPGMAIHGTMKYAVGKAAPTDAGSWSTKTPTGTEAGDYTVWYKVFGDANYRDTEPASLLVTIRGVPSGEVIPDSLVYNGKPQKLVKPGKVEGGTLQYLVSNATPGDAVIWSEAIPTGTNAGDYTVWYRVKGDENHNDTEPAFVISKISKAPITPSLSITGWIYGDKANDPVLTGNTGRGWETFLYSGEKNGQYTGTIPTKVGSWFVKAKVDETDNYQGHTTEPVSFAISKRNITILADNKAGKYGDAIQELTYRISGKVVDGDDLGIQLSTGAEKGSVPGEYPITLKWSENPNYSAVVKEGVYSIGKRSATVTAKDQIIKAGQSIATGVDRAMYVGLLNGHRLSAVTLKAASTANGLVANERACQAGFPAPGEDDGLRLRQKGLEAHLVKAQ